MTTVTINMRGGLRLVLDDVENVFAGNNFLTIVQDNGQTLTSYNTTLVNSYTEVHDS